MSNEVLWFLKKLENICSAIIPFNPSRKILFCSETGKNAVILISGYYMIKYVGIKVFDTFMRTLMQLYFSEDDKRDADNHNSNYSAAQVKKNYPEVLRLNNLLRYRNDKLALTNNSYKKLLRYTFTEVEREKLRIYK